MIAQDAKYGISVARNGGIEKAGSQLVLLLDADLIPSPCVAEAHMSHHQANAGALACGRVLPYPPAYRSFVERAANPDAGLDRGTLPRTLGVQDALGGHMSFSIKTFHHVGPFDPSLRGFEDIDFAYRAQQLGHPILYCPEAISYHNHPRTVEERMGQARSYNRMVPALLERHPALRGALPGLRDYEPLDLRRDRGSRLRAKVRTRLYATAPVRACMAAALRALESRQAQPRLAKALYWRLLTGHWCLGFREGSRA